MAGTNKTFIYDTDTINIGRHKKPVFGSFRSCHWMHLCWHLLALPSSHQHMEGSYRSNKFLIAFFPPPPFYSLSSSWSFSFISMQTGFQWLELDSQVGSTTDHYQLLCIQHGEDLNTIRAEPARVFVNSGLDEYQELTSKGFLPLTGALCIFG